MTTPDSRPVLDVIADVLVGASMTLPSGPITQDDVIDWIETKAAAAVLAACQGATDTQQAELTNGRVEHDRFTRLKPDGRFGQVPVSRVVTEWREDPS